MGLSYTIVPFDDPNKFPSCAKACQPLWDANGGCVPPAIPTADVSTYDSCFCANGKVAPFMNAATGVCDAACPPQGLSSIAHWYSTFCESVRFSGNTPQTSNTGTQTAGATNTPGSGGTSSGSSGSSSSSTGGGDWLSNHWQWVIMLVVLVVGITGIWIGACVWRRRYLRKKDRQLSLGQKHSGSANIPAWGPAVTGSDFASPPNAPQGRDAAREGLSEKSRKDKHKKKWTVTERT
ncbi:uncharacterized protein UV8b_03606 [Ustilaginoidea virens]|uniref:Integral membrane protein n=1 Tax=Ustilaginoidea virens TaxID=1159556 RepID=A0A8E5HQ76_USTVR|nr:uncharacterized protein UV8b_03606 [Ustilaginoidea virens]QUC19365.1 hypothetical protein UV8b_03606 [Ustilaginoidea virens]